MLDKLIRWLYTKLQLAQTNRSVDEQRAWLLSLDKKIADINKWREIQMIMGVDVGYKDNTVICIVSRLGDGRVWVFDSHFDSLRDLAEFVRRLKQQYAVSDIVWDRPLGGPSVRDWDKFME